MGIRTPGPPRLRRVAEPGPVVSAASRLSRSPPRPRPPAGPPAPPRCRSEKDAPRVRAAAPAAASLQHRLTAASAPVSAPRTRALDHAALTDELRSQCEGAEAASPAAPQAHAPRGTQASQPPGLRVLPRFSRSLTLAPGPPTRQTPQPNPSDFSGNPGALASRPGIPHPLPRGPRWQRPGLGRAEGEAVGPDLGARRSRSCAGARAAAPSAGNALERARAARSLGTRAAGGPFQPLPGFRLPLPKGPLTSPRTEEGSFLGKGQRRGGGGKGRDGGGVDLGARGFPTLPHGNPRV